MSTQPTPTPAQTPAPTPAPLTLSFTGGTLQEITTILQDAINIAGMFPIAAPGAALASVILQIISAASARIQQQSGKPIDLSTIPYEQPIP